MKRCNAFCVKLTANTDTEQNNSSKSTFPVYVSEHFTFNVLWHVTFCHKQGVFVMYGDKTRAINFCKVV